MVSSEGNRIQSPITPFERQAQPFPSSPEFVSGEIRPGEPMQAGGQLNERVVGDPRQPFWFLSLVASSGTTASFLGLAAVVLSVVGLSCVTPWGVANVSTLYTLAATTIVSGLAFIALGLTGAAWANMFRIDEHAVVRERNLFFGGIIATLVAGTAAVILGVLNAAMPAYVWYSAGAALLLGLALFMHSIVMWRVSHLSHEITYRGVELTRPSGPFAVNILSLAPPCNFIVGLGGIVLCILAVMQFSPVVLSFVAFLAIGIAVAFTASTICIASLATLHTTRERR